MCRYVQMVQNQTDKFYKSHNNPPVGITPMILRTFPQSAMLKKLINTLGNTHRGEMDNFKFI